MKLCWQLEVFCCQSERGCIVKLRQLTPIVIACVLVCPSAFADYLVKGPIEGNVCWGLGIEVCGLKKLDAVKGADGRLFTISDRFKSVSEYNSAKGRCWIRTKSTGGGLFSWGVNAAIQPEFFEKTDSGEYKKHDVEYVTFKCIEQ